MNDEKITIYVCTHKKFNASILKDCYKPLLCGAANFDETFGYLTDDTGENISSLNKYYAELTGQYWVWKNSNADIIGFCHYRRYFSKNFLLRDVMDENQIKEILSEYDMIIPPLYSHIKTNLENIRENDDGSTYHPKLKEWLKLREIIKEDFPDYLDSFDKVMDEKGNYPFNMLIAKKELVDGYFKWLFRILDKLKNKIDFDEYKQGNMRLLGFVSEYLLTVYIEKHNFKVKKQWIIYAESKVPHLTALEIMHPLLGEIIHTLYHPQK